MTIHRGRRFQRSDKPLRRIHHDAHRGISGHNINFLVDALGLLSADPAPIGGRPSAPLVCERSWRLTRRLATPRIGHAEERWCRQDDERRMSER